MPQHTLDKRLQNMGQALAGQAAQENQQGDPGRQALETILAEQSGQARPGGGGAPGAGRPTTRAQPGGTAITPPASTGTRPAAAPAGGGGGQGIPPAEQRDSLERRLRRLRAVNMSKTTSGQAFLEQTARTWTDNVLQAPRIVGDILAGGAATLESLAGVPADLAEGGMGQAAEGVSERFSQSFPQQQQSGPAGALRDIPMPDTTDIGAGMRVAGGVLGQGQAPSFEEARSLEEDRLLEMRQQFPEATSMGDVAGDVLSVLSARGPTVARGPRRQANRARESGIQSTGRAGQPAPRTSKDLPPGVRRRVRTTLEKKLSQRLGMGGKKIGEAGLEGAMMGVINEGDPAETAAMAAGLQTGQSLALEATDHIRRNPTGIGGTLVAGTAIWQMAKEATPGGNDYILESFETSAEKMIGTLALGALSGLAGGGRASRQLQEDLPTFADAITAAPRNAVISMAEDMFSREHPPPPDVDAAFQAFTRNPDTFGRTARNRLQRAFTNPRMSPQDEIEHLIENSESFRNRLDEITAPAD